MRQPFRFFKETGGGLLPLLIIYYKRTKVSQVHQETKKREKVN
jgi:hypothetical protein